MKDKDGIELIWEEYIFDIQYFASPEDEGRTEEPTEKKKSKARDKGQVAKSHDLGQDIVSLICFFLLSFLLPYIFNEFKEFTKVILKQIVYIKFTEFTVYEIVLQVLLVFFKTSAPVMFTAFVVCIIANIMQVGWKISFTPLKPDLKKILPTPKKLLDKLFSKDAFVMLLKSVAKVTVIAYFAYHLISKEYPTLLLLPHMEILSGVTYILKVTYRLIMQTMIILIIISTLDYYFQKKQHKKSLMMTKQDVKDELKQTEGNPEIKAKIKEKQRRMAMARMMAEVPKAEVVITNPTHFSVALKYQAEYMNAPQIVAKGEGFIALKIREIAKEHGVPLVENKPLARSLYYDVEIGEEIPVQLYSAVAEVLSFVYRLKQKVSGV
ncbi:MAG: flagellar biosynthesis protein FlhB [bacterium]|nr:flagellar biosynthesis protein FlhB [bacterium]